MCVYVSECVCKTASAFIIIYLYKFRKFDEQRCVLHSIKSRKYCVMHIIYIAVSLSVLMRLALATRVAELLFIINSPSRCQNAVNLIFQSTSVIYAQPPLFTVGCIMTAVSQILLVMQFIQKPLFSTNVDLHNLLACHSFSIVYTYLGLCENSRFSLSWQKSVLCNYIS